MKIKITLFILLIIGITSKAATIYVNTAANGSNNGTNWANAYTNLQTAINAAAVDDQVWVAKGTYFPTQLRITGNVRSASFIINKNIKVYGGFNGTEATLDQRDFTANTTTLSGDLNQNDIDTNGNGVNDFNLSENVYTVVFFSGVNATTLLDGFKVTGGNADGTVNYNVGTTSVSTASGGGIYNLGSAMILNNLKLINNSASFGGGFYSTTGASAQLNNSEATYNFASYGAAIWATLSSLVTTNNSDFYFNRCSGGTIGAINTSVVRINNGEVAYNSAGNGGGFYIYNSNAILYNVKVSNNTASTSGGGIYCVEYGVATLYNTLISKNSASSNGGGIYNNDNSYSRMTNATITGNTAGVRGGGIYNEVSPDNMNTRIYNSIIWGNTAVTAGPSIYYTFYAQEDVHIRNSIIAGSGGSAAWNSAFGYNDGNNYAQDPLFVNAVNDNYTLQTGSVGFDNAYNQILMLPNGNNSWTAQDLDANGNSRLQGAGVDMGAFESNSTLGTMAVRKSHFAYNNPVKKGKVLTLASDLSPSETVVTIFDIQGKLIKSLVFTNNPMIEISVDQLNPGIYFCRVDVQDHAVVETLKIVVE